MIELLTVGIVVFASTNVDDIFLLSAFFADLASDAAKRRRGTIPRDCSAGARERGRGTRGLWPCRPGGRRCLA